MLYEVITITSQWGAISAGSIGRKIYNIQNPVTLKEISKFLFLLNTPQNYSPSLNELIGFEVQKSLAAYLGRITSYNVCYTKLLRVLL